MKEVPPVPKAIQRMTDDADPMSSLRAKLNVADPEIQHYVSALEAKNLKLQKQIAKHQVENVSLNNRIALLEEENERPIIHMHVDRGDPDGGEKIEALPLF